jgi:hypothetical protein
MQRLNLRDGATDVTLRACPAVVQFAAFGARSIALQAANLDLRGAMLRAPAKQCHPLLVLPVFIHRSAAAAAEDGSVVKPPNLQLFCELTGLTVCSSARLRHE